MKQNLDQFLRDRLLISESDIVCSEFDELKSIIRMFIKDKLKEQRHNCWFGMEFEFNDDNEIVCIDEESITNAKEPEI